MGRVIVTGGAGYIGSHTVVELAAAGRVPVLVDDLRNSQDRALEGLAKLLGYAPEMHRIDCTDEAALERVFARGDIDGVIHFAADKAVGESVAEPLKYYTNNIGSLIALLAVMERHGVRKLVFSSSCTVYGQPRELPVDETAPDHHPTSPYGFTKVVCEQLLRDVSAADPLFRAALLRYFNPIGAHPSAHIGELPLGVPNNLVPFVMQTAAGLRDQLVVHGDDYDTPDGSCIRDYIHVVDLAQAHVKALAMLERENTPQCDAFNLGTGQGHSVLEVVRTSEEVIGRKLPYTIGPRRAGDVASVYADATKAREVLGWTAQLGLREALEDAWRWQERLGA
ncbi:MAG: UDP-glucose 4-epimerase GalE [Flavobacteriales bacterium]|nr:UDP-glucose 4-epimerase GalE [Flavobacteriales bacterium]